MHVVIGMCFLSFAALPTNLSKEEPKPAENRFARWEKEIEAIEKRFKEQAPPRDGIAFVGSSSIRRWDVRKSFPERPVYNCGFGGSIIEDSTHFAPRIILPHKPRTIVFYAGDNDLQRKRSPETVRDDFVAFCSVIHNEFPKTQIIFIAIKPSPSRSALMEVQKRANDLIREKCKQDARLVYLDIVTPMLDAAGKPREELFVKDMLHMSPAGYEIWNQKLLPLIGKGK